MYLSDFIGKLKKSWFQLATMVILLVAMNTGIEALTDQNVPGAEILLIRSICNLILALLIALLNNKSIVPRQPKLQFGAFACLGLSLLLMFTSYQYISAGSVSTLQRLDIPLLVLIATLYNKFSRNQFWLSILSFGIVATLILLNKSVDEAPIGYALVLTSVVLVTIYTILQKKISAVENIETIMVIVSLSSIFWAGIRSWQTHSTFANINLPILFSIVGLSFINLIIFYILNSFYKIHSTEFIRYPYLVAAFVTMIVEMIMEQKLFSPLLICGNIAILIVLTLLVRSRHKVSNSL